MSGGSEAEFFAAYDAGDWEALQPYLQDDTMLTSQATNWLLDRWEHEGEAMVAAPSPPAERTVKFIGGVDV